MDFGVIYLAGGVTSSEGWSELFKGTQDTRGTLYIRYQQYYGKAKQVLIQYMQRYVDSKTLRDVTWNRFIQNDGGCIL